MYNVDGYVLRRPCASVCCDSGAQSSIEFACHLVPQPVGSQRQCVESLGPDTGRVLLVGVTAHHRLRLAIRELTSAAVSAASFAGTIRVLIVAAPSLHSARMSLRLSLAVMKQLGVVGETLQKKKRRDVVQACIDHIRKHPEEADMLHLVLAALPQLAKASVRELVPSCSTHIGVLPLKLQKAILTHLRNDWDRSPLKKMHTKNPKQIAYAVCFALGVDIETSIQQNYVDELMGWAEKRSTELSHRIRKATIDAAMSFQFSSFGVYSLVRDPSCADPNLTKATHIEHLQTKRQVLLDANTCITTADWFIKDHWSQDGAALRHKTSDMRQPLFSLFMRAFPDDFKPPVRKTAQQNAAETKAAKKRRVVWEEALMKYSDDDDGEPKTASLAISQRRILTTPTPKKRRTT